MARMINTIITENNVYLNVATIESYIDITEDEKNPVTLITTISGRLYRFLGTAEILEENLK